MSTSLLVANVLYFHHLIQSNDGHVTDEVPANETVFVSNAKPLSFAYVQTLFSILTSQSLSLLVSDAETSPEHIETL